MIYEQGSKEWLELRKNKIGASDVAAILGIDPHRSAYHVWQDKLGLIPPQTENWAMKQGKYNEPMARAWLEDYMELSFKTDVKFHKNITYLMASLDAISTCGTVLCEIKCQGTRWHEMARSGKVPDHHYAQCQTQLEVCGLDTMFYLSFKEQDSIIVTVHRNEDYIDFMLSIVDEFWQKVLNLDSPDFSDKDYVKKDDKTWIMAIEKYLIQDEILKKAQEDHKEARDHVIQLTGGYSCQGAGVRVQKVISKGAIQYEKIPQLQDIDLNQYRKPDRESFRISKE